MSTLPALLMGYGTLYVFTMPAIVLPVSAVCKYVLMQLEFERKAADERIRVTEAYDSTLEERAKEQAAELANARDKESQHRATAAQMRFCVICF